MNKSGKGFLLTANFYKSTNDAAILDPNKRKPEGKSAIQPEGMAVNNQENKTTKKIVTQEVHANNLHAKLGHAG